MDKICRSLACSDEFKKNNRKFLQQIPTSENKLIELINNINNLPIEEMYLSPEVNSILKAYGINKVKDIEGVDFSCLELEYSEDIAIISTLRAYEDIKEKIIEKFITKNNYAALDDYNEFPKYSLIRNIGSELLSVRAYNCLLRGGIKSFEELAFLDEEELDYKLSKLNNLGIITKREIISALEQYKSEHTVRYKEKGTIQGINNKIKMYNSKGYTPEEEDRIIDEEKEKKRTYQLLLKKTQEFKKKSN